MTLQVMYGTKGRCFLFRENIGLTVRQKLNVVRDFSTNISQLSEILIILTTPWSENRNPDHAMVTATTTVVRKLRA